MKSVQPKLAHELSARCGVDEQKAVKMLELLSSVIGKECGDLHRVAIPGFGSFKGEKRDEEVRTDLSTGKRQLCPPEITVSFTASGILRNRLK